MEVIKLTVRQSNTAAIALYERFGYRHSHPIANYYSRGETGLVMQKVRLP
jgi:ribosomal protein S18 acetylase RimI-like enzyme